LLRAIPANPKPSQPEADDVLRAKSLLFFYALQDRYGAEVFGAALSHMLYARRGGGFDLDDLIAAFEQEAHQSVAQFVRLWMKPPGVPEEFRARYENSAAFVRPDPLIAPVKENIQ
jgi:aminopeptidase N